MKNNGRINQCGFDRYQLNVINSLTKWAQTFKSKLKKKKVLLTLSVICIKDEVMLPANQEAGFAQSLITYNKNLKIKN